MVDISNDCKMHEAHETRLGHLEKAVDLQWKCMNDIKTRINVLLGGVAISCVLMAIDIIIRIGGR